MRAVDKRHRRRRQTAGWRFKPASLPPASRARLAARRRLCIRTDNNARARPTDEAFTFARVHARVHTRTLRHTIIGIHAD